MRSKVSQRRIKKREPLSAATRDIVLGVPGASGSPYFLYGKTRARHAQAPELRNKVEPGYSTTEGERTLSLDRRVARASREKDSAAVELGQLKTRGCMHAVEDAKILQNAE
jgi:hypothetical protein